MSSARFAILGGGMLGLTLAHRLAQRGENVTVFEAAPSLGGLAAPWQLGDITWDRHYHVTLLSDRHLRSLLSELELERELRFVTTKTGFYCDGQLYSMSDVVEFLRFPPLGLVDKLRLASTILYASRVRDWRALENISVTQWLTKLSGRRTFEKLWLPLLRAKLGDNYRDTSAAFIWAIIARMYAARRSGAKREMFGYVPGGYARILKRFEEMLRGENVCIETGHVVERVSSDDQSGLTVRFQSGRTECFDRVVLTMPAPLAARVCPQLRADEAQQMRGIRYQGIVCASLLLKRPLAHYYVTNITDDWVPFTAVIEMSALVDRSQLGGRALVYLPKYLPSNDPGFAVPDEQIETEFTRALSRMYPGFARSDIVSFRISRARYVLPIATLGYSQHVPPMATSVPGLFCVNAAHILNGTLNVNETVRLANETVSRLLASVGHMAAMPSAVAS